MESIYSALIKILSDEEIWLLQEGLCNLSIVDLDEELVDNITEDIKKQLFFKISGGV